MNWAQPAASESVHARRCSLVWGCLLRHGARAVWGGCCGKGLTEMLDMWKITAMPWPETRQVLQKGLTIGVYSCRNRSFILLYWLLNSAQLTRKLGCRG